MTGRPLLVAPVPGFTAWALGPVIERAAARLLAQLAAGREVDPALAVEVRVTAAAVRQAGEAYRVWASGRGRADLAGADVGSGSVDEFGTGEAAGVLGVTARQVRRLLAAGELDGRRVGAVWLVDRASVEARKVARAA